MKKTNKIKLALIGTIIAGSLAGCGSERVVYERPTQPPHIEGYEDEYWVWDEEDGEWEYAPPGGGGGGYYYNGGFYKKSIKNSGYKSTAALKSVSTGKVGGFGSSFSSFGG